ncbi:uncharacterized protein [Diadema antillarum]|uniref:uncharacterized protein n=1 Tax=Diadema antillarum TaxID=105358 RepID=UPI003A8C8718
MAEGQHRRGHQSGVRSRSENGVVLGHARIQSDHGKGGAMTSVSPTSEGRGMSKQEVLQRLRANKNRAGMGGATTSPTHGPAARSIPNNSRPHSSLGISGISSNIKVEVEVHTRLPQTDKSGEIRENRHERRSRASAGDDNDSPVPPPRRRYSNSSIFDQDPADAKQMDEGSPQVQNSDAERQRRSSKEPVPLPRHQKQRSMSQDRGTRQQRRSEAERQFLLQQYDLMQIQKQKQQEEDKSRMQQHSRDVQKEKLKHELKLLNEHENRVMHKLQKYDGGKAEEVGPRSWVRKQSQTLDRQQEMKVSASGTHQYMEATNRVMLEQQLMEKWKEARGQQTRPNQAQDPRQQRGETTHHQRTSDMHDASHQQLAQQREQRRLSHQPQLQKSSPPPVLPKPRSPKSSHGNTHQLQQHPQQRQQPQQPKPSSYHSAAEAASQRSQQGIVRQQHDQHGRHSHPQQPHEDGRRNNRHVLQQETKPVPRPRSKSSDRTTDLSPRGRDLPSRSRKSSSPRSSEASAQSHSSSDSSEVRLLNFKRLSSVGDAPIPFPSQLEKGHRTQTHAGHGGHGPSHAESSKPQIRSPVARLSQAFHNKTSSEAGQRHRQDRHSDDRERLAKETSGPLLTSTPIKSGITSREMEEIIKRTAARMMEEQQQMRVAEARLHANQTSVQGPERPRRRRRERPETEGQRGGASPSQSAGNGSHVPASITGSHSSDTGSRDTSTAIHAEVTRRARSRRRGSGGVSGSTETGGSETQTSQSTINAPNTVRARADVAAGAGPDLKTAAARGVAGVKAVTSTNELNHVQRESNKVRLDAASVQHIEGIVPTVADTVMSI